MGKSVERHDWAGNKYTEHYDDAGNKTGESRERTDWAGKTYTEHTDSDGNKAAESRERVDWAGTAYTEHTDSDGNKVGASRYRVDWAGNAYEEHTDPDGNKSGESRDRVDWAGSKYVEHQGAGHRGHIARESQPHESAVSSTASGASSSGGDGGGLGYGSWSPSVRSSSSGGGGWVPGLILIVGALLLFSVFMAERSGPSESSRPALAGGELRDAIWLFSPVGLDNAQPLNDPFAYCRRVGNNDYREGDTHRFHPGPEVARAVAGMFATNGLAIRCVNGEVYGCELGATGGFDILTRIVTR